jgi:hypothetical protein
MVFLLLQLYIDLEKISGLPRSKNELMNRAFKEAVSSDFSAAVGLLIDAGVHKDKTDCVYTEKACEEDCYPHSHDTKFSMLAYAVSKGHLATVKVLLDKGATLNVPQQYSMDTQLTIMNHHCTSQSGVLKAAD